MNERIRELAEQAEVWSNQFEEHWGDGPDTYELFKEKFVELIVREMCCLMGQVEDDLYHCFEPSERPTDRIEWLQYWQESFKKHFGIEE